MQNAACLTFLGACLSIISCSLLPSGEEEKQRPPLEPGSFEARLHNEKGFEGSLNGFSEWEAFVREGGSKAVYIAFSPTKESRRWEGPINIVIRVDW